MAEPRIIRQETYSASVLGRGVGGGDVRKRKQLEIINASNPMLDDYHTGIRSVNDINTFGEAVSEAKRNARDGGWEEWSSYPDVSNAMIERAIQTGRVTVYSSHPISDGVFVSPSKMMAQDYAGGGRVYSQEVGINDVAWINTDEGQLARIKSNKK